MKKAILFFIRCLKQTYRNKERMSIILLIPILFIIGIAWLYGEESSFVIIGDTGNTYSIGLINNDRLPNINPVLIHSLESYAPSDILKGSPFSKGFGSHFIYNSNETDVLIPEDDNRRLSFVEYTDIEAAKIAIQSRFISMCIVIPENFSGTVLAGLNYRIKVTRGILILNASEFFFSESIINIIGDYSYGRFSESLTLLQGTLNTYLDSYWISGLDLPGKIQIVEESVSSLAFTEFDIYVPAFLVFVLISSSTGVAGIIGYEREDGTIDRLKLSSFPAINLLIGLTLTQIITSLCTMIAVLPTIYMLGFPFQGIDQFFLALFITIIATLPLLGISLGFAAITDSRMATYLPSLIAIPMSFLTGNLIPLPRIPLFNEIQVWHINPFFSTGEFLRKILIVNLPLTSVFIDLFMLVLIGSSFFIGGAILFLKTVY